MGNSVTSENLWVLDTASATALVAVGTEVNIRKLVLRPGASSDTCTVQEYSSTGAARSAIEMFANGVDVTPQEHDFGPECRRLNGMILSTLTSGAKLYVYFRQKPRA